MSTLHQDSEAFAAGMREEIRSARKRLGLTQAQLAARTHGVITKAALAGYEIGHRSLRLSTYWVLARALGHSFSEMAEKAERAVDLGDPQFKVKVTMVLNSVDEDLEPIRTWLRGRYPQGAGALTMETLNDAAVAALAALMRVDPDECRRRLHRFTAEQRGSREPDGTLTLRDQGTA